MSPPSAVLTRARVGFVRSVDAVEVVEVVELEEANALALGKIEVGDVGTAVQVGLNFSFLSKEGSVTALELV